MKSGSEPARLGDVGVGQTPLAATLGSVVDLMPEAEGSFDDMVDVTGAAGKAAGGCWRRGLAYASSGGNGESFGIATRVVEEGTAVAYGDWIPGGIGKVILRASGRFTAKVWAASKFTVQLYFV